MRTRNLVVAKSCCNKCLLLALFLCMPHTQLMARNPYRKAFFQAYPTAKNSVLDTLPSSSGHCGVCHFNFDGGGPKNPYGLAVEKTDRSKEAIKALGNQDTDGDGHTNDTEITDFSYENTPTFPGLTLRNINQVNQVEKKQVEPYLTPSTGPDDTPPDVHVQSPNGGQILVGNEIFEITWTATDNSSVAVIDIYLSEDKGVTYRTLALGLSNTGQFSWAVPNRPTDQALIKVKAFDPSFNAGNDISDDVFTIIPDGAATVNTTLRDFDMPGTQPFESGILNDPSACAICHGDYDKNVEPYHNWQGSMMAHASIDPLFDASMTIANQDASDSGDLCLRCHFPRGWLDGRSVPTNGSRMQEEDKAGVACDLCHRMVDPVYNETLNPPQDAGILADLLFPGTQFGNGMFVVDPTGARRGPFIDAASGHPVLVSPFHREAAFCGTCHDVSNPVFEKSGESFVPNSMDQEADSFSAGHLMPVERTYSEWLNSAYNSPDGIYTPNLGGNKAFVSTCQDCHMHDVTGKGCNFGSPPTRLDMPLHDMTGGSTWVPQLLGQLYPGKVNQEAIDDGIQRARYMLQNAADLELTQENNILKVTVTNNTGHKLPTGYPEGRRIWINVKFFDDQMALLSQSGGYDFQTGQLLQDEQLKVYEAKPGLDSELADLLNKQQGPSFHFVLNNKIIKDNRIPPRGYSIDAFSSFGGNPVGYTYEEGQFWDETTYEIPPDTYRIEVTVYYQSTSKEYITFLKDQNKTDNKGQVLYSLWDQNDKCPPEIMSKQTLMVASLPGDLNNDFNINLKDLLLFSIEWMALDCANKDYCNNADINEDDRVSLDDLSILSENWNK